MRFLPTAEPASTQWQVCKLYCQTTYINRLTVTSHITTSYCFKFETTTSATHGRQKNTKQSPTAGTPIGFKQVKASMRRGHSTSTEHCGTTNFCPGSVEAPVTSERTAMNLMTRITGVQKMNGSQQNWEPPALLPTPPCFTFNVLAMRSDNSLNTESWIRDKPCITIDTRASMSSARPDTTAGLPKRKLNQPSFCRRHWGEPPKPEGGIGGAYPRTEPHMNLGVR
jgi:hypothetical protein